MTLLPGVGWALEEAEVQILHGFALSNLFDQYIIYKIISVKSNNIKHIQLKFLLPEWKPPYDNAIHDNTSTKKNKTRKKQGWNFCAKLQTELKNVFEKKMRNFGFFPCFND